MTDDDIAMVRSLLARLPGGSPADAVTALGAGHVMTNEDVLTVTTLVLVIPRLLDALSDTIDVERIVADAMHSDDEWGARCDDGRWTGRLHTPDEDIRESVARYVGRRIVATTPPR